MPCTRTAGTLALALSLSLALTLGAAEAEAQQRNFSVGLATGAVFPMGDLSDAYETGLHLDGLVETSSLGGLPFGVRGEVGYLRFSEGDFSTRFLSGRVNAVIPFATAPDARPYLLAGGGLYNVKGELNDVLLTVLNGGGDSENRFGINLGVGINYTLGGLDTFVEARYHNVFRDEALRFIPLSLGIRF
jgi:opacity protein-like surface antigen